MSVSTSATPGWDAIDAKLAQVYGDQEPRHWGTVMRWSDGGPDPLDGISVYKADNPSHWHFLTLGFSELGEKKSKDPAVSGWGFELSLRLPRGRDKSAPEWPLVFLQKLGRYVFKNGMPFDHEHYIRWGGPISGDEPTRLEALIFTLDPQLGEIKTPNGALKFLTAIGITPDEHAQAEVEGPEKLLAQLLQASPMGITDLNRG